MIFHHTLSPEIFSLGPITLRWYGLLYVTGLIIAYLLIERRLKRGGLLEKNKEGRLLNAILIGVIVGIGGAYIYGQFGEMRTVIVPSAILLAFSSAAAVGIFFGFYPANKASQLDPIEALRHE